MADQDNRKNEDKAGANSLMGIFTSLKLTIALMILLALVSVIGTIIPQNASPQDYLQHYGSVTSKVFTVLDFPDVYHSWYFNVLLILLSLNLLACSFKSFPRIWKAVTMRTPLLTDELLRGLSFSATVKKDLPPDAVKAKVIHVLKRHFSSPQETREEETLHLFCEKSKYARLGVYIIHLSVLVILLGGMLGSLFGFRGNLIVAEGHSSREVVLQSNAEVRELAFDVRCDAFEATFYPNGAPKDYKSTLTILEDNTPTHTQVIEVNHPLSYQGLTFYQSSWGTLSEVLFAVKPKESTSAAIEIRVEEGGSFTIPETNLSVKLNRFFTDFIMESGRPMNRTDAPNNPAAELLIYDKGQLRGRTWVFKNFPGFHGSKDLEYEFVIKDFAQKQYTGLQVTRDPGVVVVWVGCSLMMLGILFTFFLSHRKVWARIRPLNKKTEIVLAGAASKNRLGFEKEFEQLRQEMEKLN
jgi:cytochrome c biogenesis protein